jgi:beta-mannosidase
VTIQPIDDPAAPGTKVLSAVLVNDTHSKWSARVHVRRIDAAGATLAEVQVPVTVRPRSVDASIDVLAIVGAPADPSVEAIVVDVASHEDAIRDDVPLVDRDRMRAWWWFAQDVARPRTEPRFDVSVQRSVSDWYVRIHARTIVRDLWIEPEGDWVECSPNLLSLLPGEKVQVAVRMRGDSSQAPSVRILAH